MKHVQASLSCREDRESSFVRCGRSVQACVCAGKAFYHRFNLGGVAVKHMDA